MRVVSSKIAILASCGRYIFRNFIHETEIIMSRYVGLVFSSTSKQMTFNDLEFQEPFCVKNCFLSGIL